MSNIKKFSSRKEVTEFLKEKGIDTSNWSEEKWLSINKGQAEIHMMALAECIWDAYNESTPKQLKAGDWHIPFEDKIIEILAHPDSGNHSVKQEWTKDKVKVSVALSARTSYTVVGEEKGIDYEAMIGLHDRLLAQDPPHSSPFENCARAMSEDERNSFIKGDIHDFAERSLQKDIKEMTGKTFITGEATDEKLGWCNNLKGFIPYRYMIDNKINL